MDCAIDRRPAFALRWRVFVHVRYLTSRTMLTADGNDAAMNDTMTNPGMSARHEGILSLLRRRGFVSIGGLAESFRVSEQTVRRDLKALEHQGLATRYHGGAGLPSSRSDRSYENRRISFAAEKKRIAGMVAAHIPEDATVFIDIGTTMEAIAEALLDHRSLTVITNHLSAAMLLSRQPEFPDSAGRRKPASQRPRHHRRGDPGVPGTVPRRLRHLQRRSRQWRGRTARLQLPRHRRLDHGDAHLAAQVHRDGSLEIRSGCRGSRWLGRGHRRHIHGPVAACGCRGRHPPPRRRRPCGLIVNGSGRRRRPMLRRDCASLGLSRMNVVFRTRICCYHDVRTS